VREALPVEVASAVASFIQCISSPANRRSHPTNPYALHFDGLNSRKAAEFCGPSRWRSNCGAKNPLPFWRIFRLDWLGHGVLAFRAEEGISLHGTLKIKDLPRFSRSDLFKLSLPVPQGVVPKKPKALIQVYFPGQTAEVGFADRSSTSL
jgi:hypothetical protein